MRLICYRGKYNELDVTEANGRGEMLLYTPGEEHDGGQ